MRAIVLILIHFICFSSFAQSRLYGVVKDKVGNPVFATNVYLKGNPQKGVTTGFDGKFNLQINGINDTLIISFIVRKVVPNADANSVWDIFNSPLFALSISEFFDFN